MSARHFYRDYPGPQQSVPLGHTQSKCYVPFLNIDVVMQFMCSLPSLCFLITNCFRLYNSGIINVGRGGGGFHPFVYHYGVHCKLTNDSF